MTVVGYGDGLHFGLTACRDVPHVQRLAVALPQELARLGQSLGLARTPHSASRRRASAAGSPEAARG